MTDPDPNTAFRARLYASLDGATCAKEGKKPDANPYAETDDLHFVWLGAWTDARMAKLKSSNQNNPVVGP